MLREMKPWFPLQYYYSILNYTQAFHHEGEAPPYGFMSYTALDPQTGLLIPIDYGSGIQWASGLRNAFPAGTLQLGLYLVGHLDAVLKGTLDGALDEFIEYIHDEWSERAVFLRIGMHMHPRPRPV